MLLHTYMDMRLAEPIRTLEAAQTDANLVLMWISIGRQQRNSSVLEKEPGHWPQLIDRVDAQTDFAELAQAAKENMKRKLHLEKLWVNTRIYFIMKWPFFCPPIMGTVSHEQIKSIQEQTYRDWQYWFVMMALQMGRGLSLRTLPQGWPHCLLSIGKIKNLGTFRVFITASIQDSDFYLFSDQDDVWLPDKIAMHSWLRQTNMIAVSLAGLYRLEGRRSRATGCSQYDSYSVRTC